MTALSSRLMIPVLLIVVLMALLGVDAYLEFVARIPNGNNVGQVHALGHVAWDGTGPLNDFGKAFRAAGFNWTRSLCEGDADGDGQSNGEELGDPCCTWVAGSGQPPLITDVVSHPGDFGRKLNASDLRSRQVVCETMETSRGSLPSSSSSAPPTTSPTSQPIDAEVESTSPSVPSTATLPTPSSSASTGAHLTGELCFAAFVVVFAIIIV